MQYFTALLAALPLLAPASAIPVAEKRQQCSTQVQAGVASWTEDALSRYQTSFSSAGTATDGFCARFQEVARNNGGSNIACWLEADGTGLADANFAMGGLGENSYYHSAQTAWEWWAEETGCVMG